MPGNRSLDEFQSTEDSAATSEEGPDGDAEPIAPTYTWSAAGGGCAECGAVVERRWRQGDSLVCPECKSW